MKIILEILIESLHLILTLERFPATGYNLNAMVNSKEKSAKIIGWRELVSLPSLSLYGIKAKVDSGAKTSSLHAFDIKLDESLDGKSYVEFKVQPLQNETGPVMLCRARLVGKKIVSDSGGHREERYVIRTTIELGKVKKRVELTLTNRSSMKYRMLIGRSALSAFYIDTTQSYLLGKTSKQKKFLKEAKLSVSSDD